MWIKFFCLAVVILSAYLHFFTSFDVQLQSHLYLNHQWLIDPKEPLIYFWFYSFPKKLLIILGVSALMTLILNIRKHFLSKQHQMGLIIFVITILLFPAFINLLKDLIRQPCPRDLAIFGGKYNLDFISFFLNRGDIKCFPGAHASAPFSMLSAIYLFESKKGKTLFLVFFLPLATVISMYQVLRGVHFITDTTFTAASAWLFIEFISKNLYFKLNLNKDRSVSFERSSLKG